MAAKTGPIHTPTDSEIEEEDRREAEWRELFEPRMEWLLLHMPILLPDVALRSVVLAMLEHGSTNAAARALRMDKRALMRAMHRAIRRIILQIPENLR